MCGYYSATDNTYKAFVPASSLLVERTRAVEAATRGDAVPESAWQAFFSPACIAIDAGHFERMFAARQAAVAYLAIHASTKHRRRRESAFRCIAD